MAASSLEGSRAHLKFAVGLGPPPPTSSSEDCEGRIVRCWICAPNTDQMSAAFHRRRAIINAIANMDMGFHDHRKRNDKDTSRQN